ncbi:MAG: DUF2680 domain-containing protein [Desulfotomaculales bacterium]
MSVRKKVLLVLAALALVGLFAGAALAQDATVANRPDADAPAFFETFLEKFASVLGVDKDKVVAAAKEAGKQVVDEAVQQGKMTADQADRIKSEIDRGRFFPCPFPRHRAAGGPWLDAVAQVLGMTADELKAELEQGKKLSDIAKEKGLTEEQLHQKVIEAKIQAIRQAVEEGKIPQDRADEMIKRLENAPHGKGFFGRPFGTPPAADQQAQ